LEEKKEFSGKGKIRKRFRIRGREPFCGWGTEMRADSVLPSRSKIMPYRENIIIYLNYKSYRCVSY